MKKTIENFFLNKKDIEPIPVLKGCLNQTCFCTGECKKVIGYKNPATNEVEYLECHHGVKLNSIGGCSKCQTEKQAVYEMISGKPKYKFA